MANDATTIDPVPAPTHVTPDVPGSLIAADDQDGINEIQRGRAGGVSVRKTVVTQPISVTLAIAEEMVLAMARHVSDNAVAYDTRAFPARSNDGR